MEYADGARHEPRMRAVWGDICPGQASYTCPDYDGVNGILELQYDYDRIRERFDEPLDGNIHSQWKYRAFLPVDDDATPVTLGEGGTELYDAPRLSEQLGVETRVKDDGRNPTGVLKDRATSVSVTRATHAGRGVARRLRCPRRGGLSAVRSERRDGGQTRPAARLRGGRARRRRHVRRGLRPLDGSHREI